MNEIENYITSVSKLKKIKEITLSIIASGNNKETKESYKNYLKVKDQFEGKSEYAPCWTGKSGSRTGQYFGLIKMNKSENIDEIRIYKILGVQPESVSETIWGEKDDGEHGCFLSLSKLITTFKWSLFYRHLGYEKMAITGTQVKKWKE